MPKAGVMTVAEADAWAHALRRDSEAGVPLRRKQLLRLCR